MSIVDHAARATAMTDTARNILVEAGAGSGKTSLLAGRVARLLANGVDPVDIAAISFTESAAAELDDRIRSAVATLASGSVPPPYAPAFPDGVSTDERRALVAAIPRLPELCSTTIHGFCRRLVLPYPVEADIDPGARVLSPDEADLMFGDVLGDRLRRRFDTALTDGDALTALAGVEPETAFRLVSSVADALRDGSNVPHFDGGDPVRSLGNFVAASDALQSFVGSCEFEQEDTALFSTSFSDMVRIVSGRDDLAHLIAIRAVTTSVPRAIATSTGIKAYQAKTKWTKLAGKSRGAELAEQAGELVNAAKAAWVDLRAQSAACLAAGIVEEVRDLLAEWAAFKRAAAVLDFADLVRAALRLLRDHPMVRTALSDSYPNLLVDEFQDTDPDQVAVIALLTGGVEEWQPRPGSLFLVGDPKQAIYRFRGADVATYVAVRERFSADDPSSVVSVTTNFRSRAEILDWVNQAFSEPLSREGQPGFESLSAGVETDGSPAPAVTRLDVSLGSDQGLSRDAEAEAVAAACAGAIGRLPVRVDGGTRPCRAGDIALLAPVGTDLWRYEVALERRGIGVATRAGKGFLQRQEVHDLIAIVRCIADPADGVALGALLRGPLVGATDEEILTAVHRRGPFSRPCDGPSGHDGIDRALGNVAHLRSRALLSSPRHVLEEAVELFEVRAILAARHPAFPERPLANVDRFLSMSDAYSVRGMRSLSDTLRSAWEAAERREEGRPDADDTAVSIVTIHASKGLEWPMVVPINGLSVVRSTPSIVPGTAPGSVSFGVLGVFGPGHADARSRAEGEAARERVRLWYVAATRARDVLVLPWAAEVSGKSWAGEMNFDHSQLPAFGWSSDETPTPIDDQVCGTDQSAEDFAAAEKRVASARRPLAVHAPGRHEEQDKITRFVTDDDLAEAVPESDPLRTVAGGRVRGVLVHKALEEILTGETTTTALEARLGELASQIGSFARAVDVREISTSVARAIACIEEAGLSLANLVPEVSIQAMGSDGVVVGIADAVSYDGQVADCVVDWKSDVRPTVEIRVAYREQVADYVEAIGARRGIVVYATLGEVDVVEARVPSANPTRGRCVASTSKADAISSPVR